VRDCRLDGVAIRAGGTGDIANATLVGNGTGVHSAGVAKIKNSLLTDNRSALAVDSPGTLGSSYNDLFGNTADYVGLTSGTGDLSQVVAFADFKAHDFHVLSAQPSTDKGDPADKVGEEPKPNGGRINLGAFGGTVEAESTAPSSAVTGTATATPTPASDPTQPEPAHTSPPHDESGPAEGGCSIAQDSGAGGVAAAVAFLLATVGRRRRTRS
jgi:hypothetical protein